MNKIQLVRFWRELRENTKTSAVISKYRNRPGYASERTLQRYAQVAEAFQESKDEEKIAIKVGWSVERILKLKSWWDENFEEVSSTKGLDVKANQKMLDERTLEPSPSTAQKPSSAPLEAQLDTKSGERLSTKRYGIFRRGQIYQQACDDLGNILNMERNSSELLMREVPPERVDSLLGEYGAHFDAASRGIGSLRSSPWFLGLCFEISLYQKFPGIQGGKIEELRNLYHASFSTEFTLNRFRLALGRLSSEARRAGWTNRLSDQ